MALTYWLGSILVTLATTTMLLVLAEVEVVTTTLAAAVKPGETTVKSEGKPTPVTASPTAVSYTHLTLPTKRIV